MKIFATALVFVSFNLTSKSQVLFSEGFTTVAPLPAGWAQQNLSTPPGTNPGWAQGNAAVFPAQSGAATSYAFANFQNVAGAATISNWLFAPNVTLNNGDVFTFYTRTTTGQFPDRLQVRMSTNGASVNVGATNTSVGDFTTLLLDINPTYSNTGYPTVWTQFTATIFGLAAPVSGRIAFRYFVEDGGPFGANSDYMGVDNVVYTTFPPCTGTPVPGNTLSSTNPVCSSINFTLSTQTPAGSTGITYQWQSGSSGTGPWTNITGATGPTLTTSQTTATFYRCNVTCSGNTATTTPLQVTMNGIDNCYCPPLYSAGCAFGDYIANVTLGSLNNTTLCTGPITYYSAIPAPDVFRGVSNTMTVTVGPDTFGQWVGAWIDYNRDGFFTNSEFLTAPVNPGAGGTATITFTVPAGATLGTTRLRIRAGDDDAMTAGQACGATNSNFGEAEDYNVNIVPCIQGVFTTQPSNATIQCSGNASFTIATTGSALSYQWQQRVTAASPWTTVTNGGIFSGATTTTLTLTNVPATMSGYQYRAVMVGPCTAVDFSTPVTLTVNPLVATVLPTSATICAGSIQQLTLTNASSPTTVTFTNNTPLLVPDGTPTGVFSTIAVSGIPAGAVVTDVSVSFNMGHTWVGDLELNLIAPNGANMNLIGELDGGTGSNNSDNFVNTVISSSSTTAISGAPAPRTGTFAAERRLGYGPAGAAQTVANIPWTAMTTTLNGNWVFGLSDWFNGDEGTLTNWSITFTYGAPATGVWTSAAPTTMFTDAAATIPYVAGSQATTIFVRPTTGTSTSTTNYSVVYSTATPCTSAATVIPVTTVAAVSGVVNPANTAACVGNNATFITSALGGNPLTYQWQVSTDAGATWTNIAGATSASYTATAVTLLMNGNRYRAVIAAAPCAGVVNSGSATLTVNPLPVVTLSATDLLLAPGQTSIVTATSNPAATSYSWTLNGATLTNAAGAPITTNSFTANIDNQGVYVVRATTAAGCTSSAALSGTVTIGSEASERLWIYPNPSDGAFQVRLYYNGSAAEKRVVSIYKANGQLVAEKEFFLSSTTSPYLRMDFDLRTLAAGTYVVKVNNTTAGTTVSGLAVIQ